MEHTTHRSSDLSRRRLLKGGAAGVLAGVAGCLGSPGDGEEEGSGTAGATGEEAADPDGYAAFFSLWDWTEQIVGEPYSFENPVEVGEMGHGWDPDGDIVPRIAGTDAFVYLDTPEFAWSQTAAEQLRADHEEVAVINGLDAIPTNEFRSFSPADDRDVEPSEAFDPEAIGEFELLRGDEVDAWWHEDHWHGGVADVPLDDSLILDVHVEDNRGRAPIFEPDGPYRFDARIADGAPEGVLEIESHGDTVELHGREAAQTLVVFELRRDDEVVFDTANDDIVVTVAEAAEVELDEFYDPHVWVDPVLAQSIVEYIAEELGEVFPDEADTFEENAAAYVDRLESVHEEFETLAAEADREVVVFAGHDSFGYVADRYGFDFRTPVGVTPDAVEAIEDVAELAETIDEYGIDTVLYDPFEAPNPDEDFPNAVDVLLENSGADSAAPLTPVEGTTPEWREAGYGWIEQMEEINLPSLRQALGVT